MMGEVSLETWSENIMIQDMISSETLRNYVVSLNCCLLLMKPILIGCAFSFRLTFLVFCLFCFFPVCFDVGDVSNRLVSCALCYSFENESEINYYAFGSYLSHTVSQCILSLWACADLLIIAQDNIHC